MPREKSRYRDKRSSSCSSESSYERKKPKSKHKKRSRSRDRSESSSHRRKRSTSRSKYKRRSYSSSPSKERYEIKSRRRSSSRSKAKRSKRSLSRERSRSRSSSRSRSKYSKSSKRHKKRSQSSSSQSSYESECLASSSKRPYLDDTEIKVEKAIKAAEAAGLIMTKISTYDYKDVEVKEDMPTMHDRNLIAELNSNSFVPKSFTSSRNKKQSHNIVIDLNAETVKVPESEIKVENDDSIINFDELPSEEELKEMWVKKLYHYRKKMLKGEI